MSLNQSSLEEYLSIIKSILNSTQPSCWKCIRESTKSASSLPLKLSSSQSYCSHHSGWPSFNKAQNSEGAHRNTVEAIEGVWNSEDQLQRNEGIIFAPRKAIKSESRWNFDPQRNCENSLQR
jgi:hypothetical protein